MFNIPILPILLCYVYCKFFQYHNVNFTSHHESLILLCAWTALVPANYIAICEQPPKMDQLQFLVLIKASLRMVQVWTGF